MDPFNENAEEIERLLKRIREIYASNKFEADATLGKALYQYGWLVENYVLIGKKINSATGASSVDRNARSKKSQEFYREALRIFERTLGRKANETILAKLSLGNSYIQSADFESSIPVLEEYVSDVTEIEGPRSAALVPAFESLGAIALLASDRESTDNYARKLSELDGKGNRDFPKLMIMGRLKENGSPNDVSVATMRDLTNPRPGSPSATPNTITTYDLDPMKMKLYQVEILINENGEVTEVNAPVQDQGLKKSIKADVIKWRFKPLLYKGQKTTMRGLVYYWR